MNEKRLNDEDGFLNLNKKDLFLFTGQEIYKTPFKELYGHRDYIEHFEEYVRWTIAKNSEDLMERYVIKDFIIEKDYTKYFELLYKKYIYYQPSVVVCGCEIELLINGTKLFNKFEKELFSFIQNTLSLNNKTKFILQVPIIFDCKEENRINKYLKYLLSNINLKFGDKVSNRIKIINYGKELKKVQNKDLLTENNFFNKSGQLLLGKILATKLYGMDDQFPGEDIQQNLLIVKEHKKKIISKNDNKLLQLKDYKQKIEWLFIGDSLSHGALWTFGYNSYIELFEKYIKESLYRRKDVVINTAVSGSTVQTTLDRINNRFDLYNPDIVHIMLGTNDVRNYSCLEYQEKLEKLIKYINKNKKVKIILSTIIPAEQNIQKIIAFNQVIEQLAQKYDNIMLVDQFERLNKILNKKTSLFANHFQIYTDTPPLHLGANGHLFVFKNLIKQLNIVDNKSEFLKYYYVNTPIDQSEIKNFFSKLR